MTKARRQLLAYRATRSPWTADQEMTAISVDALSELRRNFQIPNSVELRLIQEDELPSQPSAEFVTLYPAMLKVEVN